MTADLSEIIRLLQNLIRIGTVDAISGNTARVKLGPNLVTDWIRWITPRAGGTRTWSRPTIGEQVVVLSPGGDLRRGKILSAIYAEAFPAPETDPAIDATYYADGAIIEYNSATHALTATLPGGTATVTADKVISDAPETYCTGNATVARNLIVNENLIVNGSSALNGGVNAKAGKAGGDAIQVQGTIRATDDVLAGKISLLNHPHSNVKRGDEQSGGPL